MPVTPKDLLGYAEKLAREQGEIYHRNAGGRAFYAAFHSCSPLLERLDKGPNLSEGTHAKVIRVFGNFLGGSNQEITAKIRSLGHLYRQARRLRNKADYQITLEFSPDEMGLLLATAKIIAERVSELDSVALD